MPGDDSRPRFPDRVRLSADYLEVQLNATKAVLAQRELELLRLKGPCSMKKCRLHYAHSGPCDIREQ